MILYKIMSPELKEIIGDNGLVTINEIGVL